MSHKNESRVYAIVVRAHTFIITFYLWLNKVICEQGRMQILWRIEARKTHAMEPAMTRACFQARSSGRCLVLKEWSNYDSIANRKRPRLCLTFLTIDDGCQSQTLNEQQAIRWMRCVQRCNWSVSRVPKRWDMAGRRSLAKSISCLHSWTWDTLRAFNC